MNIVPGFFIVAFAISAVFAAGGKKQSINFKPCKRSDAKINECLTTQIQNSLPQLVDGYSKFNIPPLDPFFLPALEISKGQGPVSIDLSLQKVNIYGMSNVKVEIDKVDVDKLDLYIRAHFRKLYLIGNYTAKGKINVVPINGKGNCNITIVDFHVDVTGLKANRYEKNGKSYINISQINLKPVSLQKLIMKMDNLFQGNKDLSDNLNVVLNENWRLLYDELKPAFLEAIALIGQDIMNKSLSKVPELDIFPK